jgi:hypothetical protein
VKEERALFQSIVDAKKKSLILIRTIRGGDHRPLEELDTTFCEMLNNVEKLIGRIA